MLGCLEDTSYKCICTLALHFSLVPQPPEKLQSLGTGVSHQYTKTIHCLRVSFDFSKSHLLDRLTWVSWVPKESMPQIDLVAV